jgi:hypothetical protein
MHPILSGWLWFIDDNIACFYVYFDNGVGIIILLLP